MCFLYLALIDIGTLLWRDYAPSVIGLEIDVMTKLSCGICANHGPLMLSSDINLPMENIGVTTDCLRL